MSRTNNTFRDPVFVVGVPRSGTTVFSVKLAEATGIAMAPETHFMPEVYWPLRHLDLADDSAAMKAIELFETRSWFVNLELETKDIETAYFSQNDRSWPSLFQTILRLFALKSGAKFWGEKTPGHYRHVQTLLDWYPDCRIIFVMRDPRAVVASNMQAPFSPSYPWFVARRWPEMWEIYQSVSADPRVSMVRYEDFVADLDQVMNVVKTDLASNHSNSEEVMIAHEAVKTAQNGWRAQHLEKAAGAVNTASLLRWRSQLSPYDIWVTDHVAGRGPSLCGYKPANHASPWKHQLKYFYKYPFQRLKLAIQSAQLVEENSATSINFKQGSLLFVGTVIDNVAYAGFRIGWFFQGREVKSNSVCKIAVIDMGNKHGQDSSFAINTTVSEVLGLFIAAMCEKEYVVELAVRSKKQFFVAQRIAHAFGLVDKIRIVALKNNSPGSGDCLNIYWQGDRTARMKPLYQDESIEITATTAEQTAQWIDKICEQDSMKPN